MRCIEVLGDLFGMVLYGCFHRNEHGIDMLFSIFQHAVSSQLLLSKNAVTHKKIGHNGSGEQDYGHRRYDP